MGAFMVLQVIGLVIVFMFPELSTWLPQVVFG
jgi:TRAP-type C4-dicarboxylate transport system permease large subunit